MTRTITMGSCVLVQGAFVRSLGKGNILVRRRQTLVRRPSRVGQIGGLSLLESGVVVRHP